MGWNVLEVIKYTATNTLKPQKYTPQMSELNGIWIKLNKLVCLLWPQIHGNLPSVSQDDRCEPPSPLGTLKALCRLGVSMPYPPLQFYRQGIEARVRILKAQAWAELPCLPEPCGRLQVTSALRH